MNHKFLDKIAIADIAFEAFGKTKEELFENCGIALMDSMADLGKIKDKEEKEFSVFGKGEEDMLYNFLSELVYLKDAEGLFFRRFEVRIEGEEAKVRAFGSRIEEIGQENLKADVKAITMHMFEVTETKEGWKARVVVDV